MGRRRETSTTWCTIYTSFLVVLVILAESVITSPLAQINNGLEPFDSGADVETLPLSTDDRFIQLYSEMISVLQRLNIVPKPGNSSLCMALENIQRQIKVPPASSSDSSKRVAVVLYFEEASFKEPVSENSGGLSDHMRSICKYSSERAILGGLSSDALKEGNGGNGTYTTKTNSNKNVTSALGGTDIKTTGLSKIQIAVIVACAVVLGSCFIIAGVLRIRGCLKRYRISREAAMSVARRTSNTGLNGSNFSGAPLRRDSSSSKASRQSAASRKSGCDLQITPYISTRPAPAPSVAPSTSPQHCPPDHRPLLPSRSVKQASEAGSSHGSLAYIDEESHSKLKNEQLDENDSELESEDDPLLRKSPSSGSSIDVTMADVYNSSEHAPPVESCTDTAEDNDVNINNVNNVNSVDSAPGDTRAVEKRNDWRKDENNRNTLVSAESMDVDDDGLSKGNRSSAQEDREMDTFADRRSSDIMSDRHPAEKYANRRASEAFADRRASAPRHQFSIESSAFDVNEWTFGNGKLDWPNERDEEEALHLANSHAVTIGLNQSNGSISNNPSYCYGNQTEYLYNGGYGNVGYRSPHEPIYLDNYRNSDSCDHDDTGATGNKLLSDTMMGLSIEANGNTVDSISPSDVSSATQSISKDSSGEPLLSNNYQHLRTPSNGTARISGADNLALADSGDEEVVTNTCTVVSQIVPLAVYHRNSMC